MVSRGTIRTLAVTLGTALAVLAFAVSAVSAVTDCTVRVEPRAGAAGTIFVFHGSGFVPTDLSLEKDETPAGEHALDIEPDDSWQVSVRSRPGDEGTWTATFNSDECLATTEFRVTLAPTDAVEDGSGTPQVVPLAVLLIMAAAGAAGGVTLGRRLSPITVDNRRR